MTEIMLGERERLVYLITNGSDTGWRIELAIWKIYRS